MSENNNGKLRCDQEEMQWLVGKRDRISAELDPMVAELEKTRRQIKNLLAKAKRNRDNAELVTKIYQAKDIRESLKKEIKVLVPMNKELVGYIENRVAH